VTLAALVGAQQAFSLQADGGQPPRTGVLAESRVICEYLNDLADGKLFPKLQAQHWRALGDQGTADGILAATPLSRYELAVRPPEKLWLPGSMASWTRSKPCFRDIEGCPMLGERVDIGTIIFACAFGYLDLRFPDFDWRSRHPKCAAWFTSFEARTSMQAKRHSVA
jgi:glutathione S-transferase